MKRILIVTLNIAFIFSTLNCKKNEEIDFTRIEKRKKTNRIKWEKFMNNCICECKKKYKKTKVQNTKCNYELLEYLGAGEQKATISIDQICPNEYKKWTEGGF